MSSVSSPFFVSDNGDVHRERRRLILEQHPEVRKLYGYDRRTAALIAALVVVQFAIAAWLDHEQIWGGVWGLLALSYFVGGTLNHWLAMGIHECTHELAARTHRGNRWLAIVAGLPGVAPAAMAFWHHHHAHHEFLGVEGRDNDLPSRGEVRKVGNSGFRKMLWLLTLPLTAPFTRGFLVPPKFWERINIVVQLTANVGIVYWLGWDALAYFALSTFFGNGLHPAAAHWIHEHYTKDGKQETFSYYGPLNWLTFNVGYHVEHHDLPKIPGWRLPELHRVANSFYKNHQSHSSWLGVLWRFLTEPAMSHASRITRSTDTWRRGRALRSTPIDPRPAPGPFLPLARSPVMLLRRRAVPAHAGNHVAKATRAQAYGDGVHGPAPLA